MRLEDRVNELVRRQIFYDSSMAVKLNAVNGKWFYKVYAWIRDCKFLVKEGKYNGEDSSNRERTFSNKDDVYQFR